MGNKIVQIQRKHILGDTQCDHRNYFNNGSDAQKVLNASHKGDAKIDGFNRQGHQVEFKTRPRDNKSLFDLNENFIKEIKK